jgi:hypothetical protein
MNIQFNTHWIAFYGLECGVPSHLFSLYMHQQKIVTELNYLHCHYIYTAYSQSIIEGTSSEIVYRKQVVCAIHCLSGNGLNIGYGQVILQSNSGAIEQWNPSHIAVIFEVMATKWVSQKMQHSDAWFFFLLYSINDGSIHRPASILCNIKLQISFMCTQCSQSCEKPKLHMVDLHEIPDPLSTLICLLGNGLTTTIRLHILRQRYTSEATWSIFSENSTQLLGFCGNSELHQLVSVPKSWHGNCIHTEYCQGTSIEAIQTVFTGQFVHFWVLHLHACGNCEMQDQQCPLFSGTHFCN